MTGFRVLIQPLSNWLSSLLVSKWGTAFLLIGTLALAGSASTYLTSIYDHQAPVGRSVPGAVTPVPAQSLCTTLAAGVALPCPRMILPVATLCTPALLVIAPDIACNDR
jgi:hypothetical protein